MDLLQLYADVKNTPPTDRWIFGQETTLLKAIGPAISEYMRTRKGGNPKCPETGDMCFFDGVRVDYAHDMIELCYRTLTVEPSYHTWESLPISSLKGFENGRKADRHDAR